MLYKRTPPCPGNPSDYTRVETREKIYWRKKRGTIKKAQLNTKLKASRNDMGMASPASRRIRYVLTPYLRELQTGRLHNRITTALKAQVKEKGVLEFSCLKHLEMQRDYRFDKMVYDYKVKTDKEKVEVTISTGQGMVTPQNSLATDYYFEVVLMYGDMKKEKGLKVMSEESLLYSFADERKTECVLTLPLPKKEDWCLFLKVSSLEGNEMGIHTKHYRMKAVECRGGLRFKSSKVYKFGFMPF